MTDMLTISGGRMIARRPDGTVMLDTDDRMPAVVGEATHTGIDLTMVNENGWVQRDGSLASWRWHQVASVTDYDIPLPGSIGGVVPDFVMAMVRIKRLTASVVIFNWIGYAMRYPDDTWMPMLGDVWVADWYYGQRTLMIVRSGDQWVLRCRDSLRFHNSNWANGLSGNLSLTQQFTVDLRIIWGVVDA